MAKIPVILTTINHHYFPQIVEPLPLAYIKEYILKDSSIKKHCSVKIAAFDCAKSDRSIVLSILKHKPKVIGFSCYIWNITRTLSLADKRNKLSKIFKVPS